MRRKKTYLFFFPALICLYLFYKTIPLEVPFLSSIFILPQIICNTSNVDNKETAQLLTSLQEDGNKCMFGDLVYGNYCAFSPYFQDRVENNEASATLTTQGTVEFLHHVTVLCRRWSGPISVAVYSPPEEYLDARRVVDDLRNCDFCIRQWVTWHFFYRNDNMPKYSDSEEFRDCDSIIKERKPKKRKSQDTYPINVGRNIARTRTTTAYVFPIDIELYPSQGTLPKFERMIRTTDLSNGFQVWVLPVFEIYPDYRAPNTKSELRAMFMKKQAVSFHRYRCNVCHQIPNLTQWLDHEASLKSEVNETLEPLKVWTTVKRSKNYRLNYWEPFFIGTKDDPEFDIRLSWEGKQNKMQVAYEMCLMDYSFHIVENAFLAHAPGINVYNASKEKIKMKHIQKNNKWMSIIKQELLKKYGPSDSC